METAKYADIERLLDAATAMEAVTAGLDRSSHQCTHCAHPPRTGYPHRHYTDWTSYQVGKQLDAMVLKLRRLADELLHKAAADRR